MDVSRSTAIRMIRKGVGKVLNFVGLVIVAILLILLQAGLLSIAMKQHWALGFPVIALYCFVVGLTVKDFQTGKFKTWQGIYNIASVLLLTILGFAYLSFVLNRFNAAHFSGFHTQYMDQTTITGDFITFYFWQLFELIPGLKINDAFGLENPPLENLGFVAGLLLLTFRVVIIFVLLKAFREWWAKRGGQRNKELIRNWFASVWNEGRAEAIDEMFAADGLAYGLSGDGKTALLGPEAFKDFHAKFRTAFPDIVVIVEDAMAEGDKVVARCSVRGTHTGASLGTAATQKPVDFTGIGIARIKDGKIVEAWNSFDFLAMNKQIGVI